MSKRTKTLSRLVLAMFLALLIAFPFSLKVYGADEGTSSGTANVGNAAPTVTNSDIWDQAESASKNNTEIVVDTEYRINCTVTDNNQLNDLENVTFIIWEDTYANEGDSDSNVNHYTFMYNNATDAFDEIGPDGAGNSHLVSANCSDPADHSQTSGEFKLAFKLHKTANHTGSNSWKVKIYAYDSDTSGNQSIVIFGVAFYLEITVDDSSHAWAGLSPGQSDVLITSPGDNDIDVTVTANANFDLQAKGSGNLASGGNTIGLGNVTIHKDTLGSSASLTTGYLDIGGLTDLASGESQSHSFKLWIDVPNGTADGAYTYTLSVKGVEA